MTAKEIKQRLFAAIKGTNFEIHQAYGQYELWANDNRLEAGSIKDVYNAFVRYRYDPKYQKENIMKSDKQKLIESGIEKIVKKVLKEKKQTGWMN